MDRQEIGGREGLSLSGLHNGEGYRSGIGDIMNRVHDGLRLYGQGIYNREGNLRKVEILARMSDSRGNVSAPGFFLQEIQRSGGSIPFDMVVTEHAMREVQGLPTDLSYSINLHKETISNDDFEEHAHGLLLASTQSIVFEILEYNHFGESSCVQHACSKNALCEGKHRSTKSVGSRLKSKIKALKSRTNVRFSIDDFPMASNCIGMLHHIEGVDFVKFDGEWLAKHISIHQGNMQDFIVFINDVIRGIRILYPQVCFIAERVENSAMFDILKEIPEIAFFQGYFFEKPRPLSTFRMAN